MTETEEAIFNIKVVKRNGKKVSFEGAKIALAIKKGFDSVLNEEGELKYSGKDINIVYNAVIDKIEKNYIETEKIKIEEIQDLIEEMLKKKGYDDVYESFSSYRERRAHSRELFFDEKKTHNFSILFYMVTCSCYFFYFRITRM